MYPRDSDSRVGLIVYSYNARVLLNLDNRESKSSLERIVDNLPHLKGGRRIDRALEAATDVLKDVGTDKPKFVILVAAGQQEPDALSFAAAVKPLHQTGTKTHVLAVGDDVDPSYFKGEDKVKSSVISVPSFTDLPQKTAMLTEDLLKEYGTCVSVAVAICEEACVVFVFCNYNLFPPKIPLSFGESIRCFVYLVSVNYWMVNVLRRCGSCMLSCSWVNSVLEGLRCQVVRSNFIGSFADTRTHLKSLF